MSTLDERVSAARLLAIDRFSEAETAYAHGPRIPREMDPLIRAIFLAIDALRLYTEEVEALAGFNPSPTP